jgi:hypothetical protein
MTSRSSSSQQDIRPLLGVVAILVLGALIVRAHWVVGLGSHLTVLLPGPLVFVLALAVVVVVFAVRVVATRRSLVRRTRLVVLAPASFDPPLDAVLRCAAQLSRVRRAIGGWLDPRASAVRVLLDSDERGRTRYSLVIPERSLPAIRAALSVYERLELRTIPLSGEQKTPDKNSRQATEGAHQDRKRKPPRMHVVRAELRLARPSHEPLAHLTLDPDPLLGFARLLSDLDHQRGERAQIAVDLLPSNAMTRRRLRRRLLKDASRDGGESVGESLRNVLNGSQQGRRPAAEVVWQRAAREELASKLLQSEPLFALQVLLRAEAPEKGRARESMQALLSCFDAFAASNWFRVVGVRLLGLVFLGSDLPGRRSWFDRRMRTGLFKPTRRGLLSAREVAGFLKPPTVHCTAPEVLRSSAGAFAPPKTLPTFKGDRKDLVPLGRVQTQDGQRIVGLPLADSFFTYICGRSRWGKTELALTQFLHLVRTGHGGLFLDPHQDAIARLKSCLTEKEYAQRIVELDLAGTRAHQGQPGWNLLACKGLSPELAERRVEAIVDSFASALQWGERNNRALMLTTQATAALVELSQTLPQDLQPTIFQIATLLSDPEWLTAALPFLSQPRRQFFTTRFPLLSDEAITPVTNLIDRLRSSTPLAALLGAQQNTYDIARAMREQKIVLACPGSGGAREMLLANLLVYDLLHAAKSRAAIPVEQRSRFYVFLDEVQTYDGASSGNLAALLEQTAKYGIRGFLLNQNPERLTPATLNALTTNRSHLIVTALNAHAASLIAREWGGDPPASAITNLPRYTFLAQTTHDGELTHPFLFHSVPLREQLGDADKPDQADAVQATIDQASGRTDATETIKALNTLDARIKAHLEKQQHAPKTKKSATDEPDPSRPWRAPATSTSSTATTTTRLRMRGSEGEL